MVAKVAVMGSKGRRRRAFSLLCLFTVQVLALTALARCGDGELAMAMRDVAPVAGR